jgi:hypothetical protein
VTKDWLAWHGLYDKPESNHGKRLEVVRAYIGEALSACEPGPIRVISMCAGDGRDILGVLETHPRASDVSGRLVELHPELVERARATAPTGIDVVCADAGDASSYVGAAPADLVVSSGIFGNISDEDVRATIDAWPMLCAPGAAVVWTRHGREPDLRDAIRGWIADAGFEEERYVGPPGGFGVGLARMTSAPRALAPDARLFTFVT